MNSVKDNTHVFILRIWREVREIDKAPPEWRGVIEHVPGGERHAVKAMDEVVGFIQPYLQRMGIEVPRRWKLWKALAPKGRRPR